MTEDFLHFIWRFGLFDRTGMQTDTQEKVEVLGLGEYNTNAGPDFLNARIKIGDTIWAGNVEIHLRSADWFNHKHQQDKAYNNVILHIVYKYDHPVSRSNGGTVPTVILRFEDQLYENYCTLLSRKNGLPCKDKIEFIDPLIIDVWLNSLVIERLQQKTQYIADLLKQYKNNWEEVFYINLARTFGFGLNTLPFELMAKGLPLFCLTRHRDNPMQAEALVMGQAGFLNEARLFDSYYTSLRNEYIHLKNKYKLKPVEKHLWKFLRLRPVNFPTIRLAQFATLFQQSEGLFSKVLSCKTISELTELFRTDASEFWNTHYTFETTSPCKVKRLGNEAVNILIINAIAPFLFKYGELTANDNLKDRAIDFLNQIPSEKNSIVKRWEQYGVKHDSAFFSQGIIQLVNFYCNPKRCLCCSIGTHVITSSSSWPARAF